MTVNYRLFKCDFSNPFDWIKTFYDIGIRAGIDVDIHSIHKFVKHFVDGDIKCAVIAMPKIIMSTDAYHKQRDVVLQFGDIFSRENIPVGFNEVLVRGAIYIENTDTFEYKKCEYKIFN